MKLAEFAILDEHDVVLARRRAHDLAELLGFDRQDQARFATAVSELARQTWMLTRAGSVGFTLDDDYCFTITVTYPGVTVARDGSREGLDAAARLVDDLAVRPLRRGGTEVVVRKRTRREAGGASMDRIVSYLQEQARSDPLDELRRHNAELLETLESLRARQDELERANNELEDTNRGVMAMYQELSAELEQTNLGVVALYAELERANDELRRADAARVRLYSSVGHELKTPINAIASLSALLAQEADGPLGTEQHHQIALIRSATMTLGTVVGDLLDLARAQSHRLDLRLEPCDVVEILASLVALVRPLVRSGVQLRFESATAPLTIWTDHEKLTQIVRNLLSNAVKFTTSGEVVASAEVDDEFLHLTVRDTGVGIDPSDQERIFEEFVQVPGTHQIGHRGSGLGLALVRQLTELLGGSVRVVSEVGRGASFHVDVPVRATAGVRPLVLVIDDEVAFRYLARRLLERCGAEVVEAADGVSGLAAMRRERPDLVLLDLQLPDLSGNRVLEQRAREPELAAIPVVIVSVQPRHTDPRHDVIGVFDKTAMDDTSIRSLLATTAARIAPRER